MASAVFRLDKGRIINVRCSIVSELPEEESARENRSLKTRTFKLDSGASITCMPAQAIGIRVGEESFAAWADAHRTEGIRPFYVLCKGIDSLAEAVRFYYLQAEHFFVGTLDLGSVPIYITFDSRFRKMLLGMDLLKLMNLHILHDDSEMMLEMTERALAYKKTHLRITPKSMVEMGIYSSNDGAVDDLMERLLP